MNPFRELELALSALQEHVHILPATGQAVEDMVKPDFEEKADTVRTEEGSKGKGIYEPIIEAPNAKRYVPVPPPTEPDRSVLRYFLDGSAKTYFIGTAVTENGVASPVHLAQVGAAAVRREDDGSIRLADQVTERILVLDHSALPETVRKVVADLKGGLPIGVRINDVSEKDDETEKAGDREGRGRAAHKAYRYMREAERQITKRLKRSHTYPPKDWLVIDGGLSKDLWDLDATEHVLGAVKNFAKDVWFDFPGERLSLYRLLAGLTMAHRTVAFTGNEMKSAFWYVRIRGPEYLEYPLMGVVKIGLPWPTGARGERIPSGLIDALSRAVVSERTVAPHGMDSRWHCHLYPIYLAERAIRSAFYSDEVIRAFRWPEANTR